MPINKQYGISCALTEFHVSNIREGTHKIFPEPEEPGDEERCLRRYKSQREVFRMPDQHLLFFVTIFRNGEWKNFDTRLYVMKFRNSSWAELGGYGPSRSGNDGVFWLKTSHLYDAIRPCEPAELKYAAHKVDLIVDIEPNESARTSIKFRFVLYLTNPENRVQEAPHTGMLGVLARGGQTAPIAIANNQQNTESAPQRITGEQVDDDIYRMMDHEKNREIMRLRTLLKAKPELPGSNTSTPHLLRDSNAIGL